MNGKSLPWEVFKEQFPFCFEKQSNRNLRVTSFGVFFSFWIMSVVCTTFDFVRGWKIEKYNMNYRTSKLAGAPWSSDQMPRWSYRDATNIILTSRIYCSVQSIRVWDPSMKLICTDFYYFQEHVGLHIFSPHCQLLYLPLIPILVNLVKEALHYVSTLFL